jgi:hypothetical protein
MLPEKPSCTALVTGANGFIGSHPAIPSKLPKLHA